MKKFNQTIFLVCGIVLTLAAFPVFAQEENRANRNEINKKPFQDFAGYVKEKTATGKVDLSKPFSIELESVLTKDGKFDAKQSKFIKTEGDAEMIEIGKRFIEAVGDSGVFGYLKDLGIVKFNLTLAQNDSQTYAVVITEQLKEQRAKTIATLFGMAIRMSSLPDKEGRRILSDDERVLFNGVKLESEDGKLLINAVYEKSAIQEMINRRLRELK